MKIYKQIEIDIKEEIDKMAFSEKFALMSELAQDNFDMSDYVDFIEDNNTTEGVKKIAEDLLK